MSNYTQGQKNLDDPSREHRRAPRRFVVIGSLSFLIAGVVFSTTAIPVMASVVAPSTSLVAGSTLTTTTNAPTHSKRPGTLPGSHHRLVRGHTSRTSIRSARVARSSRTRASLASVSSTTVPSTTTPTTTTAPQQSTTSTPVTTTTQVPTPTTTVPVTTTTVAKSPPVAKVPQSIPNPAANIAPSPDFLQTGHCNFANGVWGCDNPCVAGSATALSWPGFTNGVACTEYVLQAINNARAAEGVRPMVLPTNWYSLTTSEQLFVVADLERTARGLPAYVGINSALTADAQHAAATNNDPSVAAGFPMGNDAQGSAGFGGAWSGGFTVLAADYVWMYDDTWAGSTAATSNVACTSAHAAGCWAHRDELLGSDPGYNPGVGSGARRAKWARASRWSTATRPTPTSSNSPRARCPR